MSSNRHGLNVTKPVSVWNRTIKFSFEKFFTSLSKAVITGKAGNYALALSNAVDMLSAVKLPADCGGVAWLLIQRSLLQAMHDLLKENEALLYRDEKNRLAVLHRMGLPPDDPDAITSRLDLSLEKSKTTIDENFFLRPSALPVLKYFKTPFRQWLEMFGLNEAEADSITGRFPSYFVHALNAQWRTRPEDYVCLKEAFDTPFTKASAAEQAWQSYAALLQKQVDEPMFVEAFSLRQVYVPLSAYYFEKGATEKESRFASRAAESQNAKRNLVDLEMELDAWLANNDSADAVRIISGGPGSGKSSFTKMLAARLAEENGCRVLFVPLHLLELSDDLEESVKKYIRYEAPSLPNPLAPEESAALSLIIFDGLDELAMQGKIAAELAQQFVREVRDKIALLNLRGCRLKVLISGRELAVQTNASDFKKPRQILHVLPYVVPKDTRQRYTDAQNLLARDRRQQWWSNYGKVSGHNYQGLPEKLDRDELLEITSQPLLNYLIALSFTRGEIDLEKESNLNVIYRDLLKAVYDRGWAGGRNLAVQGIAEDKFVRWLEEIAVAAWHGDGRTTTVEEIKAHTESSGSANLTKLFEEGADKGITRLLMAFYFRRAGVRESGEKTFEFTHKSFGEYLTAKRIVGLLGDIHEELERHQENVDRGLDEREALIRWIKLCGPAALDKYLFKFIENEVRFYGVSHASRWQATLCKLIGFELRNGMPMEAVNLSSFKEASRQARNAEESLIVVLNACARVTQEISNIDWPTSDRTSLGRLLYRLLGQRGDFESALTLNHLGFLNLEGQHLISREFFLGDLIDVDLTQADLSGADLSGADLSGANLTGANLSGANFSRADLSGTHLVSANLIGADLYNSDLSDTNLSRVNFSRADFDAATLGDANLSGANLRGANLSGANLYGADLGGADLREVDLTQADMNGADLSGTILDRDTY